jgi:hypothetical protein
MRIECYHQCATETQSGSQYGYSDFKILIVKSNKSHKWAISLSANLVETAQHAAQKCKDIARSEGYFGFEVNA